jgi:hypothetical protein
VPLLLVPGQVRLAQGVVVEQVPRGDRDELARGDHAGGAERHALAEDLAVRAALVDEVRDQVVAPLLAPRPDGRPHVEPVEPAHHGVGAQQPAHRAIAAEPGVDVEVGEEQLEPAGHAGAGLGQADHLARDGDRQRERQLRQVGLAGAHQLGALLVGEPVHEVAVGGVDLARGEVLRGLPAVLAVLGAVAVQHGHAHPLLHALGLLDGEPGLPGVGVPEQGLDGGVVLHVPDAVGVDVGGTPGGDLTAVHLAFVVDGRVCRHARLSL